MHNAYVYIISVCVCVCTPVATSAGTEIQRHSIYAAIAIYQQVAGPVDVPEVPCQPIRDLKSCLYGII